MEHLKEKVRPRNGAVFMTSHEVIAFLKNGIPEEYRLKDIQNPRQAKKDVLEKAKKLFSDLITLDKKKHGKRDITIVYKPKNDYLPLNHMEAYVRC